MSDTDHFNQKYVDPSKGDEISKETSPLRRLLIIVGSTLGIVGIIYISGIYQYLFYRETPNTIVQRPLSSVIEEAITIELPLNIFLMTSEGTLGTEREEESVKLIVSNADVVWDQANIDFTIGAMSNLAVTDEQITQLLEQPGTFVTTLAAYDPQQINVFFTRSLQGINGVAFSGLNSLMVADLTTVFDFRVLAHELGHVLSLPHVAQDFGRLMFQGANGFRLSSDEAHQARQTALTF